MQNTFFLDGSHDFDVHLHIDQIPFKDVYIHGILRDEKGQKFSKTWKYPILIAILG